jgi:formyltetrahydrofolate synthetase
MTAMIVITTAIEMITMIVGIKIVSNDLTNRMKTIIVPMNFSSEPLTVLDLSVMCGDN